MRPSRMVLGIMGGATVIVLPSLLLGPGPTGTLWLLLGGVFAGYVLCGSGRRFTYGVLGSLCTGLIAVTLVSVSRYSILQAGLEEISMTNPAISGLAYDILIAAYIIANLVVIIGGLVGVAISKGVNRLIR